MALWYHREKIQLGGQGTHFVQTVKEGTDGKNRESQEVLSGKSAVTELNSRCFKWLMLTAVVTSYRNTVAERR